MKANSVLVKVATLPLSILAVSLFSFGATGCHSALDPVGTVHDQQKLDDLEKEGNDRIADSESNAKELLLKYGINLNPLIEIVPVETTAAQFDWSKFSSADRKVIRQKLVNQISYIDRVFEISQHKDMKLKGSAASFKTERQNSQLYIKSLDAFESKLTGQPQPPPQDPATKSQPPASLQAPPAPQTPEPPQLKPQGPQQESSSSTDSPAFEP